MSMAKAGSLSSLIDQYDKAYNEIQATIRKIPDEKTFNQIKANYNLLINNGKKIEEQLDSSSDPNIDSLTEKYNAVAMGFESQKPSWDQLLKKKEAEIKKIHDEEEHQKAMENLSQEQLQIQQQADELEYTQRQAEEILQQTKDLNELTHKLDNDITDQHEVVVRVDEKIEQSKDHMVEGNENLKQAEKDQKKCNIC